MAYLNKNEVASPSRNQHEVTDWWSAITNEANACVKAGKKMLKGAINEAEHDPMSFVKDAAEGLAVGALCVAVPEVVLPSLAIAGYEAWKHRDEIGAKVGELAHDVATINDPNKSVRFQSETSLEKFGGAGAHTVVAAAFGVGGGFGMRALESTLGKTSAEAMIASPSPQATTYEPTPGRTAQTPTQQPGRCEPVSESHPTRQPQASPRETTPAQQPSPPPDLQHPAQGVQQIPDVQKSDVRTEQQLPGVPPAQAGTVGRAQPRQATPQDARSRAGDPSPRPGGVGGAPTRLPEIGGTSSTPPLLSQRQLDAIGQTYARETVSGLTNPVWSLPFIVVDSASPDQQHK